MNLLSNDEKNQAKNKAVIKQVISPFNKDKRMILIISDNSKALKNATKLICNNELLNELNSSSLIIDETKDVSENYNYFIKVNILYYCGSTIF